MNQITLHNDLPTLDDKLEWTSELSRISKRILDFPTPHVLGIHGDWGSGKTSFMRQVQFQLGGDMPADASVVSSINPLSKPKKKELEKKVVTIWFDAWRYQNESTPVIALIQEMRTQMAAIPAIKEKFKKLGEIAVYSVLDSLSDIGKAISLEVIPSIEKIEKRGEKWEKEHYSETLTTNSIREHLHKTIKCLLPTTEARVVIFIDDLDRCNPKAAMRLLEGLKIYLSIPNCIFVLGMNERILVDAIRDEISAPKDCTQEELKLRANHYLEKICTDIYRLPLPKQASTLLSSWVQNTEQKISLQSALVGINCLPPNPRRLKALANQWSRFADCYTFPSGIENQKIWAIRVLVTAYIHQFHRDLWERWHFNSNFWSEIQAWCIGSREAANPAASEAVKTKSHWSDSLKLPHLIGSYDEVSGQPIIKPAFPNPGDIDIFWIGSLVYQYRDQLKPIDFEALLNVSGVTA
ncbi:KAP family P-loop NTPase fold protein [Undibacterium sp. JH2W]|uniref:KAP family P-loop NTPase fold protein n=1 Tax=Undibacterium sp. JH2W TaxID=3413037 RepID=UPI003BF18ECC